MDPSYRLTRRERLVRIGGGAAILALGCVVFAVSRRLDPENRAAWLGIIGVLVGMSLVGQGLRGHRELGVPREPPPAGPPISSERTVAGILLAWLVPGLGHFLIGQRGKALLYFITITATFALGIVLAEGRNMSYERDGVYFLAYMFNGVETAVGWLFLHTLEPDHKIRFIELGFLYSAVACLLNLVAMMDFVAICGRRAEAALDLALETGTGTAGSTASTGSGTGTGTGAKPEPEATPDAAPDPDDADGADGAGGATS